MVEPSLVADVVEQFAREAALSWWSRDGARHSPAYDLQELSELDDRVEVHLEGLRHAGALGWECCVSALDGGDAGEVFGAAAVALDRRDWKGFAHVLDFAAEDFWGSRALVSAIGWSEFEPMAMVLEALLSKGAPEPLRYIGIAGHAVHRRDPGAALVHALASDNVRLRARALRAVGELGRADLGYALRDHFGDADETCRFWAAFSALLRRDDVAVAVLQEIAETCGLWAERAADLAVRRMDVGAARHWLERLEGRGEKAKRGAIVGAGSLGDPQMVPFLIGHLNDEKTSRLAAWSLSLITNADVAGTLNGDAPKGFGGGPTDDPADENVEVDPDSDLPWPKVDAIQVWWKQVEQKWPLGVRHLFGQPVRPEWLNHVMVHGNQAVRAGAAVELTLRQPGLPLFETRAPGHIQLAALGKGGA